MRMAATIEPASLRVPCPVCRQSIHPIAGRCRHCRSELGRHRAAAQAGQVAAPATEAPPRARLGVLAALAITVLIAGALPLLGV